MANLSFRSMMMMVISLVFITFLLPIGLVYVVNIGDVNVSFNGEWMTLSEAGADTVITLITTLVPLAIAIGIILYYIKYAT